MRIPIEQQIIAIAFSVILLLVTIQLVRKHRLREQYALVWLGASITIFVLTVFDPLVNLLAGFLGVTYAPTLILVLGVLFCVVVLLTQAATISSQADRIRDLAQSHALLENRLRHVEEELGAPVPPTVEEQPPQAAASTPVVRARPAVAPAVVAGAAELRKRVLVVGLDGATFDLIKPWVEAGYLPTLKRLLAEGTHGSLRSTVPPMTGPAWTTFATGVNPGKHRLYDWIARVPDSYRFDPVTALDCTAPTIYTLLSKVGRRVCALNIPMTYPPLPLNGVMVSGMPAPSLRAGITYPKGLVDDILANVGDYIVYPDPGQAYSEAGVDAFLARLYKATDLRVKTLDYLRSREAWDFAMVVFNGTDTVSHAMWKYMDVNHPLHEPATAARYGNAIRDYYQYVDGKLGEIVDGLDDDTTLIVMSDHGFGPFHKFIHVNNWLLQQGFMQVRQGLGTRIKRGLFQAGFSPMNVYDTMMRLGLGSLKREVVRGQGQGLLKTLFLSFEDVDWARTQAYSLGNVGQIYVNVIGREPRGCVRPGDEYEQVRDRIIAQLYLLRDPATGEQVVEQVFRREEIYHGDQLEKAPDIVFLPRRLEYFGFGEYEFGSHKIIEAMRRGISGTHRMNGIFIAHGATIRAGGTVEGASLVDLAPTILALMGEAVPGHMDGRVLSEILASDEELAVRSQAVVEAEPDSDEAAFEHTFSEEDKRLLAERLRSLGYVG